MLLSYYFLKSVQHLFRWFEILLVDPGEPTLTGSKTHLPANNRVYTFWFQHTAFSCTL